MLSSTRSQSEVVGVILLTGVVITVVTIGGGIAVNSAVQEQDTNSVLVDCEFEYDNSLDITHSGGDSIDTAALDVIYRNSSEERRTPFRLDGKTRFQPGDTARLNQLSLPTEILLVTDETIVCEERVIPSAETATPTPTATPTATPSPTPSPTATPTATPTPTPSPTPTSPERPSGLAYNDANNNGQYDGGEETYTPAQLTGGFDRPAVNLVIPSDVKPLKDSSLAITANRIDTDVAMTATNDELRLTATEELEANSQELRATNSAVNLTVTRGSARLADAELVSENAEVGVVAAGDITGSGVNATSTDGKVNVTSTGGAVTVDDGILYSSGGDVEAVAEDDISMTGVNATSTNGKVNVTSTGGAVTADQGVLYSTNDAVDIAAATELSVTDANATSTNGRVNLTASGGSLDAERATLYSSNSRVKLLGQGSITLTDANATSTNAEVNVTSTDGAVTADRGTLYSTNARVEVYAADSLSIVDGNATSTNGKVNLTSITGDIDGTRGTFIASNDIVEYNTDGNLVVADGLISSSDKARAYLSSSSTLDVDGVRITKAGSNGKQQLVYSPSEANPTGSPSAGKVKAQ
jgi:hypothetical protein